MKTDQENNPTVSFWERLKRFFVKEIGWETTVTMIWLGLVYLVVKWLTNWYD